MRQQIPDSTLISLFESVGSKWQQLHDAVRNGDDHLVWQIDQEVNPLIAEVVEYRAKTSTEVHQQLAFIANLIRKDADDRGCVLRDASLMSMLLERYFGRQGQTASADTTHWNGRESKDGLYLSDGDFGEDQFISRS
ncbi:hypothetical protein [Rhizobium halophytocola]|uniref:Uncharacterized protein n=1 Tax=Rhizobium halophytocola TaxID=735519 RepID=A0ABS4DZK9_9HYPH|nr:hypothetical protein [Rhizobium halophytocola]MBP1851132.1 hypothetical protein [Rhizobium halophytocola]